MDENFNDTSGRGYVEKYLETKSPGFTFWSRDIPGYREEQKKISSYLSYLHLRAKRLIVVGKKNNSYQFQIPNETFIHNVKLVHRRTKKEREQRGTILTQPVVQQQIPRNQTVVVDSLEVKLVRLLSTEVLWKELERRTNPHQR